MATKMLIFVMCNLLIIDLTSANVYKLKKEKCKKWSKWGRCIKGYTSRYRTCVDITTSLSFNHTNTLACHCTNRPIHTTAVVDVCGPWSQWSDCKGPKHCEDGISIRTRTCSKGSAKKRKETKICEMPCHTTTPKITTVTYPIKPVCKFAKFIYAIRHQPYPLDCRMYYVCEPVYSKYKDYLLPCAKATFWNQQALTCTRNAPSDGSCNPNVDTDINNQESNFTTWDKDGRACTLRKYSVDPHYYWVFNTTLLRKCPKGTVFDQSSCRCINDVTNRKCKSDPMLHFPFDDHFRDVSCSVASTSLYGNIKGIQLKNDGKNKYACFSGNSYIEVPYLRNWFAGNHSRHFSITFWYKSSKENNKKPHSGVLHNGHSNESPGFQIGTRRGVVYASITAGAKTQSKTSRIKTYTNWHHLAWVYDNNSLHMYIDGKMAANIRITGHLSDSEAPLIIGKLCNGGYFIGCLDEIKIYSRHLKLSEIKDQIKKRN